MFCTGLTSVTIPNSVTNIGEHAFLNCTGLTKTNYIGSISDWCRINFTDYSSNPVYYSHNLFINDVLVTDLIIPEGITSINNYAFRNCRNLTSVTIPNSVTSIENGAFIGCTGLTSVTIPNSVTSIGSSAFKGCSGMTSIAIPNSVTSIEDFTFSNCKSLASIAIPNSVTSIGSNAFYGCSGLTSISIPNSVTSIGSSAFQNCSELTSISIPSNVTSIGKSVFSNCSTLIYIKFEAKIPPSFGVNIFLSSSNLVSIFVPSDSVNTYKTAVNFAKYADLIKAIPLPHKSFIDLSGLKTFCGKLKKNFVSSATSDSYLKLTTDTTKTIDIDSNKLSKGTVNNGTKLATDGYVLEQITNNVDSEITVAEIEGIIADDLDTK